MVFSLMINNMDRS